MRVLHAAAEVEPAGARLPEPHAVQDTLPWGDHEFALHSAFMHEATAAEADVTLTRASLVEVTGLAAGAGACRVRTTRNAIARATCDIVTLADTWMSLLAQPLAPMPLH